MPVATLPLLLLSLTLVRFEGENPVYRSRAGGERLPFEWSTSDWGRTRAQGLQRAQDEGDDDDMPEGPWELTGVASSTSVDSYETEMSAACLRDMRDQFNSKAGVALTPSHWKREWYDVLGRSVRATLLQTDVIHPYDKTEKSYKLEVVSTINPKKGLSQELKATLDDETVPLGMSIGGWFVDYEIVWDAKKSEVLRWIIHKVVLDHLALTRSPANPDSWVSKLAAARSALLSLEEERKKTLDKPPSTEDASGTGITAARSVSSPAPQGKETLMDPAQIRALIEDSVRTAMANLAPAAAPAPAPTPAPAAPSAMERSLESLLSLQARQIEREDAQLARQEAAQAEADRKAREEREAAAQAAAREAEATRQAQMMGTVVSQALGPVLEVVRGLQAEVTALKTTPPTGTPGLTPEQVRALVRAEREVSEDLLADLPPTEPLSEVERLQREVATLNTRLARATRATQQQVRPGSPSFLAGQITLGALRSARSYPNGPSFPGERQALLNLSERVERSERDAGADLSVGTAAKALIPFLYEKPGKVDAGAMNDAFRELLAAAELTGALA